MKTNDFYMLSFILALSVTIVHCSIDVPDAKTNTGVQLFPVKCQSLPYYVELSNVYEPLVAKLHRCVGKDRKGYETHCVPKNIELVNVTFYPFNGEDPLFMVKTNHTECHEVCRQNSSVCNTDQTWDPNSCSCICNDNATKQCDEPFFWQQLHCGCRCPYTAETKKCDVGMVFSLEVCGCVCHIDALKKCPKDMKYMDPKTCLCTKEKPIVDVGAVGVYACKQTGVISKHGLIIVIIVEALVICGIIFTVKYLKRHPEHACWNTKEHLHDATDRYSIDTPTIDLNPNMSTNLNKKTKTSKNHDKKTNKNKKSRDQQHVIDISKRPFLGIGGDRKCRKYRYEMNNLVPISPCSMEEKKKKGRTSDKSRLVDAQCQQVHCSSDDDKNDDVITPTIRSVTEI